MDEEWRTTVTLSSAEDASRIHQQLGDSHGLAETGCSLSREGRDGCRRSSTVFSVAVRCRKRA